MKFFLSFTLLYGVMMTIPKDFCMKKFEKNGMEIRWKFENDRVKFKVFAPEKGWVAIGFNNQTGLPGTNLIMANDLEVSDRYIVAPGDHQSIEQLGGNSQISDFQITELKNGTEIYFSIPKEPTDKFHHELMEGGEINLLLAYSESDDFSHHSIRRTSAKIIL